MATGATLGEPFENDGGTPFWMLTNYSRLDAGATAAASSEYSSSYAASQVIDDDIDTSWYAADDEVTVPAPTVDVVDTIGAGDTVTAAVVDALWRLDVVGPAAAHRLRALARAEWTSVLEFAARAAAVTVSRPGGDPPHRHELG